MSKRMSGNFGLGQHNTCQPLYISIPHIIIKLGGAYVVVLVHSGRVNVSPLFSLLVALISQPRAGMFFRLTKSTVSVYVCAFEYACVRLLILLPAETHAQGGVWR